MVKHMQTSEHRLQLQSKTGTAGSTVQDMVALEQTGITGRLIVEWCNRNVFDVGHCHIRKKLNRSTFQNLKVASCAKEAKYHYY